MFLLLNLNRQHPGRLTVLKTCDIALSWFARIIWFIVARAELKACGTSKIDLFAKIDYSFNKKPHFKIYYRVLNEFISDLHLVQTFLFLLIFLNINFNFNFAHKCLFKVYTRSNALAVGPVQIWQQGYHSNVLGLLLLTLCILCLLLMFIINVTKCIFCGTPKKRYIFGSCCKAIIFNFKSIPMGCSSQKFLRWHHF